MEVEEHERREAAISSARSLQPDYKPEKGSITQSQLSKFQELHRRRLQIKTKSKVETKSKGRVDRKGKSSHGNKSNGEKSLVEKSIKINGELSPPLTECSTGNASSLQKDNVAVQLIAPKRQKLHWGLDTKQRWERKSNM